MDRDRDGWLACARAAWDGRPARWDAMSEANAGSPDRVADLARTATATTLSVIAS